MEGPSAGACSRIRANTAMRSRQEERHVQEQKPSVAAGALAELLRRLAHSLTALESGLCLQAVDGPQGCQPIANFKASHCANRQETSHLYLPSKSLRISEQAGMPSCPCSAPKSPLVGWSLCPSSPSLSRIASLTHFWFRWGHPLPGHLAV